MLTLIWSWWGSHSGLHREEFTSREECWKRVRELMELKGSPWAGAPERHLSLLEVYKARPTGKGHEITTFQRYEEGSPYCKWGQWGVTKCLTTGELFG